MKCIRVLVVDDSMVVRRIVAKVLDDDDRIEVVGTAPDGKVALQKVEALCPDVITLDLEMPVLSGLEALPELRNRWPELPVIVFSAANEAGAVGVLAALDAGASDYVTKPSHLARIHDAIDALQSELIPKIYALHAAAMRTMAPPTSRPSEAKVAAVVSPLRPKVTSTSAPIPKIIAIGSSTGGPKALQVILPDLPESFPVPILVAQHMPETFTTTLARSLDESCRLKVSEAFEGAEARPGEVWIAPGDYHMTVERSALGCILHLDQGPKENSCRPAVDPLFRSVASVFGTRTLAIVLTGMGSDGTEGARALHATGARVVVQDEETSVVWGMPGSITAANLADQTFPQDEIASFLERSVAVRVKRMAEATR